MSSAPAYKLYNLPTLVQMCGFSDLDLWDQKNMPGSCFLKQICSFNFSFQLDLTYCISGQIYYWGNRKPVILSLNYVVLKYEFYRGQGYFRMSKGWTRLSRTQSCQASKG